MMALSKKRRRKTLYKAQRGRCAICGRKVAWRESSIDHIVPRAVGGTDRRVNQQMACRACNNAKGCQVDRPLNREPKGRVSQRVLAREGG